MRHRERRRSFFKRGNGITEKRREQRDREREREEEKVSEDKKER